MTSNFQLRLLIWSGVAAAYWALIFVLTHIPISIPGAANSLDKVQHAGAFCGLAILLCSVYEAWRPRRESGYVAMYLLALGYGAFDELSQTLVGRHCDIRDWLADAGGAACGVGLMFCVAAFRRARSAAAASAVVSTR